MQKITGEIKISPDTLNKIQQEVKHVLDLKQTAQQILSKETTKILETILAGAIKLNASDIHIEAQQEEAKIRLRIDGVLQDLVLFSNQIYEKLLSRLKLLSGVKLNVVDRPQNGRFSVLLKNLVIEIRTSTLPTEYGESVVLRILNPKNLIEIEQLGFRADLLERVERSIKKPHGMIIVTGPTGSGKTTTLYAFLKRIQTPEIKIITIEDPIEYEIKGISQTQTAPQKGYDFANGLKSIMRQDPDVILVGEIRDAETAKTAVQAALTGHLVLTTLHTNNAAGTISRLQSLGILARSIAPALNIIIAQRLARKVCEKCVEFVSPSQAELSYFKKELKGVPKHLLPSFKKKEEIKIPHAKGCEFCNFSGYRGRTGIFEIILNDPTIEQSILTSPSVSALERLAIKEGMITMHQDGLIKVLRGVTTIQEVQRVTGD